MTAAQQHALAEYPKEACGLVVAGGAYAPVENVAADPFNDFRMPADAWLRHGTVTAVIHSHCAPQHGSEPSAADRERQRLTAVPWGIILTDGVTAALPVWFGV